MVGMLFNNILYCFSDIYIISYILNFIIGNSITTTFLLYVCSYVFGFCKWHRFIITANIINLLIANLDAYYRIPISDIQLLIVYHFVAALFICISTYIHTADNGKVCKGEIYNYDCAKNVFDKYVRNINSSITVWDVYVAINAQYHDYIRLYSEWFRNINKNELDNKIIESAITFYFKDEDSGSTKTWNYFKTAN